MSYNWVMEMSTLFKKFSGLMKNKYLIFLAVSLYTLVFSYYTVLKHYTFQSFAWDLGIFVQALYSTIYHGRLFYYTIENYVNPSGSFFAIHFSPILLILIPFYATYPKPETLLVVQTAILALGAIPLYMIAREILKDKKLSIIPPLIYLLYPALHGANWFDFHTEVFIPFSIFSMFYFYLKKRFICYFVFLFLTLSIGEYAPLIVLSLILNILIIKIYHYFRERHISSDSSILKIGKDMILLMVTMVVSLVWFFLALHIKELFPLDPNFKEFLLATKNWEILGIDKSSNPFFSVPSHIIMNPMDACKAVFFDYHIKFLYIILLFGPLLFLPLKSKYILSALTILIFFITSNFRPYYMIGSQYPLIPLPLLFIAFVDALQSNSFRDAKVMILVALIFSISTSPISPLARSFVKEGPWLWYPAMDLSVNDRVTALHELLQLIPENASVLTQNYIFPHIANRLDAYVIPQSIGWGPWYYDPSNTQKYLLQLINRSDYILLELPLSSPEEKYVFSELTKSNRYGIYAISTAEEKEAVLFKRDFIGTPKILLNLPRKFDLQNGLIIASGTATYDEKYGNVAYHPKLLEGGVFIYGPYTTLFPGTYRVTFLVKVTAFDINKDRIGFVDVSNDYGKEILKSENISSSEVKVGEWHNYTLVIHIDNIKNSAEFRIVVEPNVEIYFAKVIVERVIE